MCSETAFIADISYLSKFLFSETLKILQKETPDQSDLTRSALNMG